MDEKTLIQAARNGDIDAFNRLVLAYQTPLYNYAYRILGEEDAADDAAQEAFISAYRNLNAYRGGSFRGWLYRIVTNASYDELRRRKSRPITSLEPLDDAGEEIEFPQWIADPSTGVEERVEHVELEEAIQHCLNELSLDFRTVVVLVDVQGWNYAEAASIIRKPVGTVKSRLARARLRLQECLQGFGELLPVRFRLKREV